ncbi:MAG: hypothetical protein ABI147_04320 [Acidobacteriaceae bacterium]
MAQPNSIRPKIVWLLLLAVFATTGSIRAAEADHLSQQELKTLIAGAKTAQNHERLAKHFEAEADKLDAEANEHQELATQYKANPSGQEQKHPMAGKTAGHCQYFADDLHKAAKEDRALAADHRAMASDIPK